MVVNGINNIGTVKYTSDCYKRIAMGRKTYTQLTADQKVLVTNYDVLVAAEAEYAKLKAAADATAADKAAVDAVTNKINAIGTVDYTDVCKTKIDKARDAYDALTADQKKLVTNYTALMAAEAQYAQLKAAADKAAADKTAAAAAADTINAIGAVAYTAESKARIDAARSVYNALTADQKALVTNYTKLTTAEAKYAELKAAADQAAAEKAATDDAIAKINAIGAVEYTAESKAKIDAARSAYDALSDAQKAQITNYKTLTTAEAEYGKLKANADAAAADQAAADTVIGKINTIGTVANTAASKAKIDAARDAYNALSFKQKALVANYAALTAAETKFAELKKAAADKAAADAAIAKISAIGTVEHTAASKTKINEASIAYNALTADQKALVSNYAVLTSAQAQYNALKEEAENPRIVRSVSLKNATVQNKKSVTLTRVIDADDGADCTIVYSSANEKIASVDKNGVVTAKKNGSVVITCTVTDAHGNTVSDTCTVTVKNTWWQWIIVLLLFGWIWY